MTNREFIEELSAQMNWEPQTAQVKVNGLLDGMVSLFDEGNDVVITSFGTFEVKQRGERVIIHPSTGKKLLVPPKQVLSFKQSTALKSQAKDVNAFTNGVEKGE